MDYDEDAVEAFLAHYGVKGMKWGVRKSELPGVSASTYREAGRDAREFTKAKMYYGEGAGTRRKLIKATVTAKAAKDPGYQYAFDHHLAKTDMAKRASQARSQRKRTDAVNTTKKTARGVGHILNGNAQYASAAAALVVTGAMYARKTGIDKQIQDAAKTSYREAVNYLNKNR